jgi:outer membrane immunogenic protein
MTKTLAGIAVITALIATPALAANLPVKAPPPAPAPVASWSGCYVGANVGGIWERDTPGITFFDGGSGATAAAAAGAIPLAFAYNRSSVIGGGQLGCNWQVNTLVWGLETDLDGTDLSGGQTISTAVPGFFPLTESVTEKMNWIGTTRARIGVPWNNVLVYGTAGVAYAGLSSESFSQSNIAGGGPVNTFASESTTRVGWTAGGGLEYKWGQWSAKAEALYYDLGSHTLAATLTCPGLAGEICPGDTAASRTMFFTHFTDQGVMARVGLSYHFNFGPIATRY